MEAEQRASQPIEMPEVLDVASLYTPQNLLIGSAAVAVFVVFLSIILSRKRSSSKGNALLLVGPPDAGKTTVLSQLAFGTSLPTQTSMQVNTANFSITPKSTLKLIDIPGHPRLRGQFEERLPETKVVAFVVDASTISRNAAAVAEHLHHILHALTSLPPSRSQPALLILANKSDLLKATSSNPSASSTLAINRVKTVLERELEKRRQSQKGGINVEGLGEEGERTDMGGLECGEKENSAFRFDEWEGGEVAFLGTSTIGDGALDNLTQWLEEN